MAAQLAIAYVALAAAGAPDAASNAQLLCAVMDNTRSIAPCILSQVDHSITINIRPASEDASSVCRNIRSALMKQHMFFNGAKWRLNITVPTSEGKVVASCDLPQTLN